MKGRKKREGIKIKIDEVFSLESDRFNIILCEKRSKGIIQTYYSNIEFALNGLLEQAIKNSVAMEFSQVIDELREIRSFISEQIAPLNELQKEFLIEYNENVR